MKVVILNSGIGKRLGELTRNKTKSMVEVRDGESIFQNQIEKLVSCGLYEFVITTGYLKEDFERFAGDIFQKVQHKKGIKLEYTFVYNDQFDSTNYIMSLFKASEVTEDDVLLLHGDLIFSEEVINNLIKDNRSRVIVDSAIPLPEKDFKARVERKNGKILEIDVNLKGDNLIASQPLYKLNKMDWLKWMDAIKLFCKQGNTNVYAELALNTITDRIDLSGYDIKGQLCMEIDNEDDLNRIKKLV